jgi:hypothetical protein
MTRRRGGGSMLIARFEIPVKHHFNRRSSRKSASVFQTTGYTLLKERNSKRRPMTVMSEAKRVRHQSEKVERETSFSKWY